MGGNGFSWRRRGWIEIVAALVITAAVVVFAQTRGHGGAATPAYTPVALSPTAAARVTLADGAQVAVPAGAAAGAGQLIAYATTAPAAPPPGLAFAGRVYTLDVAGTHLTQPVSLRVPVAFAPNAAHLDAAALAYYDAATHAWTPVTATYNATARTLTTTAAHAATWAEFTVSAPTLKVWGAAVFRQVLAADGTAGQPSCPAASAADAAGVSASMSTGDIGATAKAGTGTGTATGPQPTSGAATTDPATALWCTGQDASANALLKLTDAHGFALAVQYPKAWSLAQTVWPGPGAVAATGVDGLLAAPASGTKNAVVPPGATVTLTIPPGDSGALRLVPAGSAYSASALAYAAQTLQQLLQEFPDLRALEAGVQDQVVQQAFADPDCTAALTPLARSAPSSSADASQLLAKAFSASARCEGGSWSKLATAAQGSAFNTLAVAALAWLADGVDTVSPATGPLLAQAAYWPGSTLTVTAPRPRPVLGEAWTSGLEGFGVEPATIDNGNGATGLVQSITWSSWGGSSASGTGTAEYVPPSTGRPAASPSASAGGGTPAATPRPTLQRATVVAFDLGTCNGKPAYRAVEWYFPGYGQSFDPDVYENACTGAFVGGR